MTKPPMIEDGHIVIPDGQRWRADVNEDAVPAHPPVNWSGLRPDLRHGSRP